MFFLFKLCFRVSVEQSSPRGGLLFSSLSPLPRNRLLALTGLVAFFSLHLRAEPEILASFDFSQAPLGPYQDGKVIAKDTISGEELLTFTDSPTSAYCTVVEDESRRVIGLVDEDPSSSPAAGFQVAFSPPALGQGQTQRVSIEFPYRIAKAADRMGGVAMLLVNQGGNTPKRDNTSVQMKINSDSGIVSAFNGAEFTSTYHRGPIKLEQGVWYQFRLLLDMEGDVISQWSFLVEKNGELAFQSGFLEPRSPDLAPGEFVVRLAGREPASRPTPYAEFGDLRITVEPTVASN